MHQHFLNALSQGFVPGREEAQTLLSEDYNSSEEQYLMDNLRQFSDKYDLADFDAERLQQHIEHDIQILKKIQILVAPITPDKDAKLQKLKEWLSEPHLKGKKRLIFTQYADIAKYLYDNLNPQGKQDDIEVIYSGSNKSKVRVVGRFAPKANKEYKFKSGESELKTLIATEFAIYEQKGKQLSLFDFEESEEFLDLNEAEEIFRQLQKNDPGEFERIANLPHGIRTAKSSMQQAT